MQPWAPRILNALNNLLRGAPWMKKLKNLQLRVEKKKKIDLHFYFCPDELRCVPSVKWQHSWQRRRTLSFLPLDTLSYMALTVITTIWIIKSSVELQYSRSRDLGYVAFYTKHSIDLFHVHQAPKKAAWWVSCFIRPLCLIRPSVNTEEWPTHARWS